MSGRSSDWAIFANGRCVTLGDLYPSEFYWALLYVGIGPVSLASDQPMIFLGMVCTDEYK